MSGEREHYIDLVRGIRAVSIILIHTCFFSGTAYVPMPMRSISLLLDVPAFFFIAGMTTTHVRKDSILTTMLRSKKRSLNSCHEILHTEVGMVFSSALFLTMFLPIASERNT